MNKLAKHVVLLLFVLIASSAHSSYPNYADGDLAPLGMPDGLITLSDYLLASRIVLGQLEATELELSHGDLYPPGAPDGVINLQDLLLLQKKLGQGTNTYVETLDLFSDGPAAFSVSGGSNTILVDGYTSTGTTVVNDPNRMDPDDPMNTVWYVAISGGIANVSMRTGDLSSDPVLDSGFDLSGSGLGQLVFDIKVNNISPDAVLTVKIDSGYPNLGQVALASSQYTVGEWRRIVINFADLLANPGPGGSALDLKDVVNAFVMEVTGGSADFYLDNIFISHACSEPGGCSASINTKATYSLVWGDEFDGNQLSSDNWSIETGYGSFGWGNDEWQQYTNSPSNVSVAGGNLIINARCANPPACGKRNGSITSGRINSLNKFSFKYGKVEARLKPPVGKGAWPAFWMLGKNFPSVGWPRSGEIDVMEMHNFYSDEFTTHFTLHWCDDSRPGPVPCAYDPGWKYISKFLQDFSVSLGDDYHVFSAEWNAQGIVGKIDDIPYYTLSFDPATMEEFLEEFFMILNVAIGGTLGGPPDASTPWPQTMLVDYVRVYREDGGEGTYTIGAPPPTPEMGVYSESNTETVLPYSRIINGADFGGNLVSIDGSSTATAPFDGNVSLRVAYSNSGKSYGGFLFDFASGSDISYYQTLKFSINKASMSNMTNLNIELENPGSNKFAVQLRNYAPTLSGNWATYEIPLSDFGNLDPTNIRYLGFWTPRTATGQMTFGTLYFDDIHFAGGG